MPIASEHPLSRKKWNGNLIEDVTALIERRKLVLVDYENVHKVDLSVLDDSYSAIIFVGVNQNIPQAARKASTAHRFRRADFRKVGGAGKNALDFHIAFQLGRTFETSPSTICIVL